MALVMVPVAAATRRVVQAPPAPPPPPAVPYILQHAFAEIETKLRYNSEQARQTIGRANERLKRARAELDEEDVGTLRLRRDLDRRLHTQAQALDRLNEAALLARLEAERAEYVVRYKDLDTQERERKRQADDRVRQSETRFLPMAPMGGDGAGKARDNAKLISQEILYAHGMEQRPVELIAFDMCPKCKVAMQHNVNSQHLVCPIPSCGHWKRFADMTSAALAFGEEVEFCRYSYKPVTHLEDTIKFAEAGEAFVVPPNLLEIVMRALYIRRVRPEFVTIPMIREIIYDTRLIKTENTVQIYSRLTGRAPRRFSSLEKDKFRIMFQLVEKCSWKHRGDRVNNLSYPYTLYKYCELLGYWEMLETLPLLRGNSNLGLHDVIQAKVHKELGWEFIPTVKELY